MKWFDLLKNKNGKLTFGLPQMAAIAGVGLVVSFTAFQADKKVAEEERVRSLSAITNGYNYDGMRQVGRDGLTSINVKDGLNQVATAEERARLEQGRMGGGDFGLSAADNLGGSVSSSLTGRAAETTATEGLGMGRNAVVMQEGTGTGRGNGRGSRVNTGALGRRGTTGRGNSSNTLAPVATNHAGGKGINASYGGANNGNSQPGSETGVGKGEGYHFSGSMPGGTDPLSMRHINGQNSTFMAGGRNATVGRGRQTGRTGNDLKDISKRSADVARNANRASNEGSTAFLAGGRNSGGMDINSGVETTQTGSADFAAAEVGHVKGIKKWGEQTSEKTDNMEKHMTALFALLFGLIGVSAWAWGVIKTARKLGTVPYYGMASNALALGVAIALTALWAGLAGYAIWYNSKFFPNSTSSLAIASWVGAGLGTLITWLVYSLTSAETNEKALSDLAGSLTGKLKSGTSWVGMQAANMGKTAIQDSMTKSDMKGRKS